MNNSFLTPVPIVLQNCIRIFGCIRDVNGRGRIYFIEVDKNDQSKILKIANKPVLDLGGPGMFDEDGGAPFIFIARKQ